MAGHRLAAAGNPDAAENGDSTASDSQVWRVRRDTRRSNNTATRWGTVPWVLARKYVYLASVPRSGNTWTRYLLEEATGVATESIFMNDPCFVSDICTCGLSRDCEHVRASGELEPRVVKTHFPFFDGDPGHVFAYPSAIERAVLLVRNPVDNYLAWLRYTEVEDLDVSPLPDFQAFLDRWVRHFEWWFLHHLQLTVVRFEDLLASTRETLTLILEVMQLASADAVERAMRKHPVSQHAHGHAFASPCAVVAEHPRAAGWASHVLASHRHLMVRLGYAEVLSRVATGCGGSTSSPALAPGPPAPRVRHRCGYCSHAHWRDAGVAAATGVGEAYARLARGAAARLAELGTAPP